MVGARSDVVGGWSRPRVKPEHRASRLTGGRVRFGGELHGITSEVPDPSGMVWTLAGSLDGSRTSAQLVESVHAAHPGHPVDEITALVEDLGEAGHLEDAAAPVPDALSERERCRYDRGRSLWRWMDLTPRVGSWDVQLALRDAAVLVIGVGGTGGAAATSLAASGIGRLHLVDPDHVELSNLNRQTVFGESDIGRRKVDAAVDRLRGLNSDVTITVADDRVDGIEHVTGLAAGFDVVALCADDPPEIREWVNRAALRTGFPWVDAGYHGPRVGAGAFVPGQGACYECLWTAGRAAMERAGHLDVEHRRGPALPGVTAVTAALSGQLSAHLVMSLVTGVPRPRPGRIDFVNLAHIGDGGDALAVDPDPACPACGVARG